MKSHEIKLPFSKPQKCVVTKCTFPENNIRYEKNPWTTSETLQSFRFDFMSKVPGIHEGKIYIEDENKIHAFNVTIMVLQGVTATIDVRSV